MAETPQEPAPQEPTTADSALAYLREHGGRFTLDSLREQLLASGRDPATVEAAVAAWRRERAALPAAAWPRRAWPLALLVGFANLVVVGGLTSALLAGINRYVGGTGCLLTLPILVVFGGEIVVGTLWKERPFAARVLVLAPVFSVAIVAALLVGATGFCIIALNSK